MSLTRNRRGAGGQAEVLSSPTVLEANHTGSGEIFMDVSESVHEEPSAVNTNLASNL
jgi:hypothetical protein